ncbi:MAG: ChbG/HpnK family deacetylase [Bosea sp. (in: a-proteobacteria)]
MQTKGEMMMAGQSQAYDDIDASNPVRIILCADDFALTYGVSRAILELLEKGAISATGAMTNRPHWPRLAQELMGFSGKADLGLHFNLTCAEPLSDMPVVAPAGRLPTLRDLARKALVSSQARAEIATEVGRQLDAFEQHAGRPPDFVDGHQHVHVLPGVRRAVLDAVASRYRKGTVYLRNPADRLAAIRARGVAVNKALVIAGLATGFAEAAKRRGIPVNDGFSGASPFDPARNFAEDFEGFLMMPGKRHLVMCHPGHIDSELAGLDPVTATRPLEYAFFAFQASKSRFLPSRFTDFASF